MKFISVFEVIGPSMVGPSSSHTAGALEIGFLSMAKMKKKIVRVKFTLYGSFARTGKGHGTDLALLAGVLGLEADDLRIKDAFLLADEAGIKYEYEYDFDRVNLHPNTVDVELEDEKGNIKIIRGESLGGGKVSVHSLRSNI